MPAPLFFFTFGCNNYDRTMKGNDWKKRLNIVYSTNPEFQYETESGNNPIESLPKAEQKLRVSIERKNRGGKTVTLVSGFKGTDEELKEVGKMLKAQCGVGGSSKNGLLLIQGDFKDKVINLLKKEGYAQTK